MRPIRVTAVVVAYNGGALLERCVEALLQTSYRPLRVLIVDNASDDRVGDELAARGDERVHVLRLAENRGFAGAVNAAIAHLDEAGVLSSGDVLALVNQDCIVSHGWLGPLVAGLAMEDDVAVIGARILEPDGATLQHAGGVVHGNGLTEHLGRGSIGSDDYRERREVEYVTGALCAFRVAAWTALGPLDEGYYPAYFEEVDFCVRARAAGWRILYEPESVALHHEASSSGRDSDLYLQRYHRSRIRFVARHLLRRGSALRTLWAELRWLVALRSRRQLLPAVRAYLRLPAEMVSARRRPIGGRR